MDHRPPIPPGPQPVAPALQRPYEPPPLLGHPYDTFNGLTAAVAAQMPVQPPPLAIQTALPPLGGQPVPLKRPAPESQQKKKRVRRHWDECTNCDSKHGMRYGRVVNRQIQYLGCDRCKGDYFSTHGVKLKDLTRVCECGSGKDRRYGPKGGTAVACVECKDQKVSSDGQPLINLRPSTGQCSCGSGKVKRFGYPPPADQGSRKGPSARTNCIDCKTEGMVNLSLSASRRVEAPSRHRRASSPGMMDVGGFFFDFEAVRTVSSEYDAPRRSLSKKPEEAWGGKCSCGSNKVKRFGVKGGPRTACIECKSENMINLTTKICTCGSDRQVRFGRPGGKPEKCSQCKTEGMVDLTKKKDEDPALG